MSTRKKRQAAPAASQSHAGAQQQQNQHAAAPAAPVRHSVTSTSSSSSAHGGNVTIEELRQRWQKPLTRSQRVYGWFARQHYRYNVLSGCYVFDWWEALMVNTFIWVTFGLILYGTYKQASHLIAYGLTLLQ